MEPGVNVREELIKYSCFSKTDMPNNLLNKYFIILSQVAIQHLIYGTLFISFAALDSGM